MFNTVSENKLIEALIKDNASIKKCTETEFLEEFILEHFLPQNKQARMFAVDILYGEGNRTGIGATLEAIFSFNAAGNGNSNAWGSTYDNLLPFVEFALSEQPYCNYFFSGKEEQLHHFHLQLESICEKLENLAKEDNTVSKKAHYEHQAQYAQQLLKEVDDNPQGTAPVNFYKLAIDNWEDLKNWSITYRMLSDLAAMCNS